MNCLREEDERGTLQWLLKLETGPDWDVVTPVTGWRFYVTLCLC
jgi:hypothetical protein